MNDNTVVNTRAEYFDRLADKWDGFDDQAALQLKLTAGLDELGVLPNELVVDIGCGTGNLTIALLGRLSQQGRVCAVDISTRMLEVARGKISDARVLWHREDAVRLSLARGMADRVICCSVWPHFEDKLAVAAELGRVLRGGGILNVWHLTSRERINKIHSEAGACIIRDVLAPASETARLLESAGFVVVSATESDTGYLVTAEKPANQ